MPINTNSPVTQLSLALAAGQVAAWLGDSGGGKTEVAQQLAPKLGLKLVYINCAHADEILPAGWLMPDRNDNKVLRRLLDPYIKPALDEGCLVIFDEATRFRDGAVRNAFLDVFQAYAFAGQPCHPDTRFLLLANPSWVDADARDFPAAMANRLFQVLPDQGKAKSWERPPVSLDEWLDYARGGPGAIAHALTPSADWRDLIPECNALVADYCEGHIECWYDRPDDPIRAAQPWPSPRQWLGAAAPLMAAALSLEGRNGMTKSDAIDLAVKMAAGCVGNGAVAGLFAFIKERDLPRASDVLANPTGIAIPQRSDKLVAVCSSVVGLAVQRAQAGDIKSMDAAAELLVRVHNEFSARDVATASLAKLIANRPSGWRPGKAIIVTFSDFLKATGMVG